MIHFPLFSLYQPLIACRLRILINTMVFLFLMQAWLIKILIADGNYTEGFYQHDLFHFKQTVFNLFKHTYAKASTDENIFYNQMTDRLKTLSVNDLNASIQKIFQLNQVYGEYLNIINHQDNFTDRERIIAEIIFFDFTHEDGKVFFKFSKIGR